MKKSFIVLLVGIGICCATNPSDEKQFKDQLRNYAEKNNGYFAGLLMRGVAALNGFKIKNLGVLSLAYLNDPQVDRPQLVGFGLLGKWFFNSNKI